MTTLPPEIQSCLILFHLTYDNYWTYTHILPWLCAHTHKLTHLGAWLTRGSAWYWGKLYVLNSSLVVIPGQVSSVGVPVEEQDRSIHAKCIYTHTHTYKSGNIITFNVCSFVFYRCCLTKYAEYEVKLILHCRSRKERPACDHFIKDTAHTPRQRNKIIA